MVIYDGITRGVLFSALFCSLGALSYGVDNGWWATALGVPAFNAFFGTATATDKNGITSTVLSATEQSAGTSLGQVGIIIGTAISVPINRYYGRKAGIFAMGVISVIGVLIQITASVHGYRYWQLVVGRLIMGIACNVVPIYQSELAPAKWRGALINLYQCVSIIGVVITTAIVFTLAPRNTSIAWQVPIGMQMIVPVLLLAGVKFMPESPRWLVWQNRTEEAQHILHFLHGANPTYSAAREVQELQDAYDFEKAHAPPSLTAVFKGSDRRRALIAIKPKVRFRAEEVIATYLLTGSAYMTNYIVLFLVSLGITNILRVIMTLYCVYLAAILFSFFLPDRFGRRPMLLGGAAVCAACLLIVSSLNVAYIPQPLSVQNAALGLIFIWYFTFGLVWSPLVWITSTEVCSARAREPTLAVATFSGFTVGLIIVLVSPYIQDANYGNLGGSIGFLWGGATVISVIWVYFLVPELKGLPLEIIDRLFDEKTPTRKFQARARELLAEKTDSKLQTLPEIQSDPRAAVAPEEYDDKFSKEV